MALNDKTEHQSDQDRVRSRDLSLKSSQPPAKISGYSIEQFLGAGAYGEVWSGTEKKTGRRVAIKFYTRRTSDDVELLAREVEKLVALSADRYVVQLVDVDWQAEPPYFIMDYFEHGSLEDLLNSEQTLPVAMAEDLFSEIATGMMHLHGKGIFHCDLKPGNVLLDQDGKPRLADFGQARLGTESSPSLGTMFFMAPEQADLDAVPAAEWDVYALGALLYCMLVGKPPYHNDALTEKIDSSPSVVERLAEYKTSLKNSPPPTEHRSVAGVDRMLADIIDRAIAANPKQRYENVQSIMFALRQRELSKARRPLLVLGILGPLLLLTVMSLFSWFAYRQAYADTEAAIKVEAVDGNEFAAKMAARSAAEKIDQYFRAVEELARNEEFVEDLILAISDKKIAEIARQLDDPNKNAESSLDQLRQNYRKNPVRLRLQSHLDNQMKDPDLRHLDCASWFANDIRGNQIGSIFQESPETITLGRNYSYRTYFTGFDKDQKKQVGDDTIYEVEPLGVKRPIIKRSHLSSVFLSKGTFTWKVAFSTPVFRTTESDKKEIIGIVACTAEIGSFFEFENTRLQYALLVDAREGYKNGVILEHPVFDKFINDSKKVPRKTVDLETVGDKVQFFIDPIRELPEGESFDKKLIAALQAVKSPRFSVNTGADETSAREASESGLYVLVAEDYGEVIKPVHRLSSRLFWLAIYATMFFLVVALLMWLLVFKMLRESNNRLSRTFSGGDSSFRGQSDSGRI